MSVQFSSQKPGVGIRDQNRRKSLSGINDGACHLDAFLGRVKAEMSRGLRRRDNCQRQENDAFKQREEETKNRGVQEEEPRGPERPPAQFLIPMRSNCAARNWIRNDSFMS